MPKTIYQNVNNQNEPTGFDELDLTITQTTRDFLNGKDIQKIKTELRQGYKKMGTINLSIAEEFGTFGPIELSRGAFEDD